MSRRTAVYRLYDADERLLYVGVAVSPRARLSTHAREKPWWGDVKREVVEWHPERSAALAAEAVAIHAEGPVYNRLIPADGDPAGPRKLRATILRFDAGLYERLRKVAFDLRVPMSEIIAEGTAARVAELEAKAAADAA